MRATQPLPTSRERLSLERIVAAALDLARQEGAHGISMRPLAARLGVTATALYGHVASRDELLALMLDRVLAEVPPPAPDLDWAAALRLGAVNTRDALASFPQLALEAMSGRADSHAQTGRDDLVDRLVAAGFPRGEADLAIACWARWTLSYLAAAEHPPAGVRDPVFEHGVDLLLHGLQVRLGDRVEQPAARGGCP